ncbi:MAG: TolC family protein, partial [Tannerellaceae bacterium]
TAMQPIFAGGKIVNGNRLAQVAIDAAQLQHNLSKEEVLLKTERYYWQIVSIKEHLMTLSSVDTLLARIHIDVQKAVEVGITSANDRLKVELQQNQMASNRLELNNVLLLSKMLLAQYIGLPMDALESLDIACPVLDDREKATDYFVMYQEVLTNLSSYQLLDKNIEATRLETRMKRGEYLPTVAIGASYFNEDVAIGKHTNHTMIGATVAIPLSGWWGGSHAIKKKKIAERKALNEKEDLSGQLVLKMQQTWNSLTEAEQQIALAKSAVGQSTENLRMNRDYYNAGTAPLSDLLDAQTLYQQTCNRLTNAQVDFRMKLREYLTATGRGL